MKKTLTVTETIFHAYFQCFHQNVLSNQVATVMVNIIDSAIVSEY